FDSGLLKVLKSQLPAKVIAPVKGAAGELGVPSTVTCGPPTSVAPASGVATSTHESAAVTIASPLDVLTMELEFPGAVPVAVPMPDWPPKATLIVVGDVVVLVQLASQRPQFALLLMNTEREIVTPPRSIDCVVVNRLTPSKVRPKPRRISPLNRGAGDVCTRTFMPAKPLIVVLYGGVTHAVNRQSPRPVCVARMLPVSTRGDAASWIPQKVPLASVT